MQPTGISPSMVRILSNAAPDLLADLFTPGKLLTADVVSVFQDRAILSFGRGIRVEVGLQVPLQEGQKVTVQVQRPAGGAPQQPAAQQQGAPAGGRVPAPPMVFVPPAPAATAAPAPAATAVPAPAATAVPAPAAPAVPAPAATAAPAPAAPAVPAPAAPAVPAPAASAVPAPAASAAPAPAATAAPAPAATAAPAPAAPAVPAPAASAAPAPAAPAVPAPAAPAAPAPAAPAVPAPAASAVPAPAASAVPAPAAPAPTPIRNISPGAVPGALTDPSTPVRTISPGAAPSRPTAPSQAPRSPGEAAQPAIILKIVDTRPQAAPVRDSDPAATIKQMAALSPVRDPGIAAPGGQAITQTQPPAQQPGAAQVLWLPIPLPDGTKGWAQIHAQEDDSPKTRGVRGGPVHQVRIFWETPALGPVQVTMEAGADTLSTVFTTAQGAIRSALEQLLPDLQERLTAAGFPDARLGARTAAPGETLEPARVDGASRLDRRL